MGTKAKRAIFIIGVTAAVYAGIRYLLPLLLPFFISYGIARMIWPFVRWANQKLRLPEIAGTLIGLFGVLLLFVVVIAGSGWLAWQQICELMGKFPEYITHGEKILLLASDAVGKQFGIGGESAAGAIKQWTSELGGLLRDEILPRVISSLIPTAVRMGNLFAGLMIAVVSAVFFIREREAVKEWVEKSVYRREIRVIAKRLGNLGRAFLKTQGVIFLLVMFVCTVGLRLIGNRYFLLIGVGIALLDMLPVFGTGCILLPWAVVELVSGRWVTAGVLALLYFLTYYLREFLEAHMMGKQLGITSLEMMIAMYAGFKLFGLWGLFLGPIGWILIKEIDNTLYIG